MEQKNFKVYGYRWIVLLAYMAVVAINQLMWITFAPITVEAARYFKVSDLSIGILSMVFMIVYIVVSIPASWIIDTKGIRIAVGIGAVLTGLFGLVRGIAAPHFVWVLLSQIGIAVGQPFILNAVTTVAARWFPVQERATASGFGTLAMYLGILVGLSLTPYLTIQGGIGWMLVIYGIAAAAAAGLFFAVAKERPPTPPCPPGAEERSLVFDGFRQMIAKRDFIILLLVFFVGLGAFNAVATWIENIVRPRGFSITQAGNTGGLMILGGLLGALIVPMLSDRRRKRTPFLVLAMAGSFLGLVGIAYAADYRLLLASAFAFGFFLLSAGPIGFQYGAEITHPAPEGTSNGLLLLMGQVAGILFIFGMDAFKSTRTGSMAVPLAVLAALMVVDLAL